MIIRPAHFVACKNCKHHGHIVFGDGTSSKDTFSSPEILNQIKQAIADGKMIEAETEFVMEGLAKASLFMMPASMINEILENYMENYTEPRHQMYFNPNDRIHWN